MTRETACLRCDTPFDWESPECPSCGWNKATWVADGRYGLQLAHDS